MSFETESINQGENYGFTGANEVPLHSLENSPYCGEIGGVDGAVSTTNMLCKHFGVENRMVTQSIDNAAVLCNIFGPDESDTSTPCFHLIKRVRKKIADSPVTWIRKKLKTHQDDNLSYDELDSWAKANVVADKLQKNT